MPIVASGPRVAHRAAAQIRQGGYLRFPLTAPGRRPSFGLAMPCELFISPKTASVHVSAILHKLGVTSRIQAAAIARR
jgi:hypothetical protein